MAINRDDPEVQALLEAETEALVKKNRELVGELRVAKAKAKGAEIDPEEHERLRAEVESLTERLSKTEKTSKTELDRLTKALGERESALSTMLIDSGISDALAKSGVAPHYVEPLKAMFKTQAKLTSENGSYSALIGDKPLAEAIKGYLGSDAGKHFIGAPASGGGGANAGAGGAGAPGAAGNLKRSSMSVVQKAEYIAEHGQDAYLKLPM